MPDAGVSLRGVGVDIAKYGKVTMGMGSVSNKSLAGLLLFCREPAVPSERWPTERESGTLPLKEPVLRTRASNLYSAVPKFVVSQCLTSAGSLASFWLFIFF